MDNSSQFPYRDILHLPHPVSPTRAKMSMVERAAQFAPFAALTGHEAAIQETARLTDAQIHLDMDGIPLLDAQIRLLAEQVSDHPEIFATCFVPDERKAGGAYHSVTARVRKILEQERILLLEDDIRVPIDRIVSLTVG